MENIQTYNTAAAFANESERAAFIRKTYSHLAFAVLAFAGLSALLVTSPLAPLATQYMTGGYGWLLVLGAFMAVAYIADKWARSTTSVSTQYMGLGLFVVAEAIIMMPLLYLAALFAPDVLPTAGLLTLMLFAALTLFSFTNKINFSFLRGVLVLGSFIALGVIVASIIFGFTLGLAFSGAMIVFAAGSILYDTSRIIHEYGPGQHVAAALSLFASVALLFWYMVQFLMGATSGD